MIQFSQIIAISFLISCAIGSAATFAEELKIETKLIWGTLEKAPDDPKYKPIDTPLTKKLQGVFKWKHFYEMNQKVTNIALNATAKLKMSEKCDVEVKNLGKSRIEVKLFGAGKVFNKTTEDLAKDDRVVVAGECENMSAWFVVIKPLEPATP